MLGLPPSVRLFVATELVDGRKGPDSLMVLVRDVLGHVIFEGHLFIFFTRRRDRVRIVYWDRNGIASGKFAYWPSSEGAATALEAHELSVLLFGGDWAASRGAPIWRPVTPPD